MQYSRVALVLTRPSRVGLIICISAYAFLLFGLYILGTSIVPIWNFSMKRLTLLWESVSKFSAYWEECIEGDVWQSGWRWGGIPGLHPGPKPKVLHSVCAGTMEALPRSLGLIPAEDSVFPGCCTSRVMLSHVLRPGD